MDLEQNELLASKEEIERKHEEKLLERLRTCIDDIEDDPAWAVQAGIVNSAIEILLWFNREYKKEK